MNYQLKQNNLDKLQELIDKADTHIDKLNRLIEDLLDVAKLKDGRVGIDKKEFDFSKMIAACVETVHIGKPSHDIKIAGETGIQCYGDEGRLEQVFVNLLNNAIKYSPKANEVLVYVTTVSNFIKVTVTDHGVGIKIEDYRRIFERFYRAENTQKIFPGIGIGLYVCEQIIQEHGGTLWVESEEEKGSIFSFTIPMR